MGELHQSVTAPGYATSYAYQSQNCYQCHLNGSKLPICPTGTTSTAASPCFDHVGIAVGQCAGCHDVGTIFASLPMAGFTHVATNGVDCGACHTTTSWLGATGAPAVVKADPSQAVTLNALIATYSGTSIASLSPQSEVLQMPMSHVTTEIVAEANSACANCHSSAANGSYYPGNLHNAIANLTLPEPTACGDCHQTSMPTGFVGPIATIPARTPPSGEMKHDGVAWANGAPTTTSLLAGVDCGVCHLSPSGLTESPADSWANNLTGVPPALYHSALVAAALYQPTSCLDCHANSRPTGVLTSANSALTGNTSFDHTTPVALGECANCHSSTTLWAGGMVHPAGAPTPPSCLPCHEGERPTSTSTWASTTYMNSPFDYVPGLSSLTLLDGGAEPDKISHGDGQDCVVCHTGPGTGAWGGTENWQAGTFPHGASTVAGTTCIACHTTQRPDLQPGATEASATAELASVIDGGFDHVVNGQGDCFGCHQATVKRGNYVNYDNPSTGSLPGGDWQGANPYPGSTLIGGPSQFISINEITLQRTGTLVTGETSSTATLYNEMQHLSTAIPAAIAPPPSVPPYTNCWHCHSSANGVVTAYINGQFHSALTNFTATPGGTVAGLPQPTSQCTDCHTQMRPVGIVEKAGSDLQAMDHSAAFTAPVTINGTSVSGVAAIDCSTCHHSPGQTWADGVFHANIQSATPQDCTVCHYPLMADAASSNLTNGTLYQMNHESTQLTFQSCATCHIGSQANGSTSPPASTLWKDGVLHANVSPQPTACVDCHVVSEPAANASTQSNTTYNLAAGGTATNGAQWMNHGAASVAGLDCAVCHQADAMASGSAWSKSDLFHTPVPAPTSCQQCHGLTNGGGSTPGTGNNLPSGLTNSTTVTSAASDSTTGVTAGTLDQINHSDANATSHDCNFCHTQVGLSTNPAIQGKEWAQASFHKSFSGALTLNGTTGRCSNCHLNVIPTSPSFPTSHSAFTDASGSQDCSGCHTYPGTGSASSPNWLGATAGAPACVVTGGFTAPENSSTVAAISGCVPHPSTTSTSCATCHTGGTATVGAIGYDHASSLVSNSCSACHEAGSPLVGTPWNGAVTVSGGAGDTRPWTIPAGQEECKGGTCPATQHFFGTDCYNCHNKPGGVVTSTGSGWGFQHPPKNGSKDSGYCAQCHD